jgi:hypothetical protein
LVFFCPVLCRSDRRPRGGAIKFVSADLTNTGMIELHNGTGAESGEILLSDFQAVPEPETCRFAGDVELPGLKPGNRIDFPHSAVSWNKPAVQRVLLERIIEFASSGVQV